MLLILLLSSFVAYAEDLKTRVANLAVGEVLRDEATGMTAEFLQKHVGAGQVEGWQRAESKACGFGVDLFGPFNELKQVAKATDGAQITIVLVGNSTQEGAKFSAVCWRRSDNTFKSSFIADVLGGFAASNDVLERRRVKRNGYESQRIAVKGSASYATIEMFQLDHTIYQLTVEYPLSEATYMPELAEKFLASFRRYSLAA